MLKRQWFIAVWLAAGLSGCAVPQPQNTRTDPRLMVEPITGRVYYLFVPDTYTPDKPAPVIVSCHGTDPFDVAAYHVGEWKKLAENHGCILVCPKMVSTDGILGAGAVNPLLRDECLIMAVIGQLHYLYNIDRRNILITGFSGGGFPVYFVGLRHPDVFSAIAARNCNFNRRSVDGWYPPEARNTPIKVYYGQNDPGAIRAQSEAAIAYLHESGFTTVETEVIPGAGHERHPEVAMKFWLRHWNGVPPPYRDIYTGKPR
jgi:poly(3-hydroxybutyrate) depolymerase